MWADGSLRNESRIDVALNYGDNGLNKNNFSSKFEFDSGGELKDQMFGNRLNCTESVLLSPYFQSEAKKLRDQARQYLFHF